MATRTRDDSAKEKRGKISPKPLKIDSPDPKVRTPTSSDKHVPNYLKPTLSSGLEQQGKKPTDAAHKPMLNRRRSFDSKPQSPTTQAQRSRASLKPTQSSWSFSGKTTGSDKNSMVRGNKEGAARSVGSTVKKQQQSSAGETSTMKKEENPCTKISDDDDAIEIEIKDEEIVQIGEDDDHDHRTEAVAIVKDDDQIVINEEAVSTQEDAKEHTTNEENNVNDNNNNITSDETTAADNVSENAGDKDLKEEEAASGESAAILSEDKEVVVVRKPRTETINAGAAKYQGKRESAVSNDVIEETASKLREQRKNKVKALAGAFETVISLQETNKYR